MRLVLQRVKEARVRVGEEIVGEIGQGLLTLLGIARGDSEETLKKALGKIADLRVFEDEQGKMNRSLREVGGGHLIVSQFTLLGDASKGRRPNFMAAEDPVRAQELYEKALVWSVELGINTAGGRFGADMRVEIVNDGPVTLVLDF